MFKQITEDTVEAIVEKLLDLTKVNLLFVFVVWTSEQITEDNIEAVVQNVLELTKIKNTYLLVFYCLFRMFKHFSAEA
jgi:hypothetical protein